MGARLKCYVSLQVESVSLFFKCVSLFREFVSVILEIGSLMPVPGTHQMGIVSYIIDFSH
ncbi:hypothetical protein GCM10007216_06870 [Thalassobacillus devorans]|uniref:Uncharacterized protein n=1 Tax=Thalassobacillus devorans TaxID=279813 RepID=A0ABQ1NNB2_9BACI|nr:hypothetical protein [Thalassobacillus devorans]NIK27598.1 hypothetical protein [Thalassobacillus devorans]GGC79013.1 hypothetical protein GCM10007216_06870 [Thalassobacillus devorans]